MRTADKMANILVNKYYDLFSIQLENTIHPSEAIDCAILAADEMITYLNELRQNSEYWQQVRNEIIKIKNA